MVYLDCLNQDPSGRPSFETIIGRLNSTENNEGRSISLMKVYFEVYSTTEHMLNPHNAFLCFLVYLYVSYAGLTVQWCRVLLYASKGVL